MKKNFHAINFEHSTNLVRTNRTKYSLEQDSQGWRGWTVSPRSWRGRGGRRLPQKALNYRIRSAWPGRGVEDWTMAADQRNQFAICAKGQMCILRCVCVCVRACITCDGQVDVVDKGARSTLNLEGRNEGWPPPEPLALEKKGNPRRWRPPLLATKRSGSA